MNHYKIDIIRLIIRDIYMKKGFTLVELLAVIIILGVIALITFPIVDNSIKNSKQAALEQTIDSILESARNYSVEYNLGY